MQPSKLSSAVKSGTGLPAKRRTEAANFLNNVVASKGMIVIEGAGGTGKTSLTMGFHASMSEALRGETFKSPAAVLEPGRYTTPALGTAVAPFLRLAFDPSLLKVTLRSKFSKDIERMVTELARVMANKGALIASDVLNTLGTSSKPGDLEDSMKYSLLSAITALEAQSGVIIDTTKWGSTPGFFTILKTFFNTWFDQQELTQLTTKEKAERISLVAGMPEVWTALWGLIKDDLQCIRALARAAFVMGKAYGFTSAVRNEVVKGQPGIMFQLDSANHNTYFGYWPDVSRGKWAVEGTTSHMSIKPEDLVLGLSMFTVVWIGTLDSHFGNEYSFSSTLKGGLSEGVMISLQRINTIAMMIGARILAEVRDQYSGGESTFEPTSVKIPEVAAKLMACSQHAIYLTKRGQSIHRTRAYADDEIEFIEHKLNFEVTDIPSIHLVEGTVVADWGSVSSNDSPYLLACNYAYRPRMTMQK